MYTFKSSGPGRTFIQSLLSERNLGSSIITLNKANERWHQISGTSHWLPILYQHCTCCQHGTKLKCGCFILFWKYVKLIVFLPSWENSCVFALFSCFVFNCIFMLIVESHCSLEKDVSFSKINASWDYMLFGSYDSQTQLTPKAKQ